tara:strand:- start:14972 stop:15391 length:420 start_codon:yes stop_codon:yes gene_type:complete
MKRLFVLIALCTSICINSQAINIRNTQEKKKDNVVIDLGDMTSDEYFNNRDDDEFSNYLNWEDHLEQICREKDDLNSFFDRKKKIHNHMSKGEFKYPELNEAEQHAIRVIASSLYDNIKTENDKALKMYQELDRAFVKK